MTNHIPYINIHTHTATEGGISVLNISPDQNITPAKNILYSAGIHPWDAVMASEEIYAELELQRLDAIGEIGLDYLRGADKETQKSVLARQLHIASARRLPVIIHCVKAYNDLIGILAAFDLPAVIIHGFTGSTELAGQLWSKGYYTSFGHRAFDSPKTIKTLEKAPIEKIFAETDTESVPIEYIYKKISEHNGCSIDLLRSNLYSNFVKIFGL